MAVLDRLTSEKFLAKVEKRARSLRRGLNVLARKHPAVVQVRSLGLMVGVELKGSAAPVVKGLREHGVLATRAGDNVLRLLPPLVIKQKDIRQFLEALDAVLMSGAGATDAEAASMKGTGGAVA
jgi:acetylornithine/succinyldiaminopimelate/putrescine aminotransferase